jgi:transcriptional regulator with XRE-family HTH domain
VKSQRATGESPESAIGARIRSARDRLGWSREALAYKSGLSWSAIEQIESGRRRNSRPDTLGALSQALGITIDYLVTGRGASTMAAHQVFFYGSDEAFLSATAPYLSEGIERSEALLTVTSARNIGILRDELGRGAADQVEFVEAETWYHSPVSAMTAYRAFLDHKLAKGARWARIVGDPGWPGRTTAEITAWKQYESLVNLVFGSDPVTLLCTYDERAINSALVTTARSTHPWIFEGDEISENPAYKDTTEFVLGDD